MIVFMFTLLASVAYIVNGQCAITSATIELDPGITHQLADRDNLVLTIRGITTGAQATSVTWRWNGLIVNTATEVAGGSFFDGGGEIIDDNNLCEHRMYRVALQVTGYLPGSYTYTVTNADTPTPVTSPVFQIEDPGPPTSIVLNQISNLRIRATWTPPVGFPGATYRVYLNTLDINTGGTEVTGTTWTSETLITSSVTLRVRATTGTYLSVPAVSSPQTHTADVLSPIITIQQVNPSAATLSFSQPTYSLSVEIYTVTLAGTCTGVPTRTGSTTSTSITVDNLEAGTQYSVSVTGRNTMTNLMSTGMATLTTASTEAPSGSPGVPTASVILSTTITLTWTEIECIHRKGEITHYIIKYGDGITRDQTINTNATTQIITGLKPFTLYTFTVAGVNIINTGPFSSASGLIRTSEDKPSTVRSLHVKARFFSITLSWTVPEPLNGILIGYNIQYSVNGIIQSHTTRNIMFSISNLNPNTIVYNITVSATTGGGQGPPSHITSASTLQTPAMVSNVMAELQPDSSVTVVWNNTGFRDITTFVIYYRQICNISQIEMMVTVPFSHNSVNIENLIGGSHYIFEVVARALEDGKEVTGMRVASNPVMLPCGTTTSGTGIAVAAILSVILTAIVYSVVLVTIVVIIYYKKQRNKDPKSSDVPVKDCAAYEQVSVGESK